MYYEWKVCNSREIQEHKFPYLNKTLILNGYFNQEYRIWMTVNGISLYQTGMFVVFIPFDQPGEYVKYGDNNYYKIELAEDGTFDVYHGQIG